ncbi:MAG: hypothetical protein COV72_08975 [Candidatus Omnitrophica bacterium CG11_big_fil_rev_8_21_14_0_20_42_13]|uniref:Uncharacterized protein n=1 Tax=Candidatus Ghiorseimicrobium undicola TaxID=1974746 RepID=A0A2H0LY66_9BACT|nr:MAG: hypothetical protein COV72_08975 [Candidatus Omnitrophica bacterium CG11_big_fil_rev_8_21_14_0_20_42_13]
MNCPRCAKDTASQRCSCGWDFGTNSWQETYIGEKDRESLAKMAITRINDTAQCTGCKKNIPFFFSQCPFCNAQLPDKNTQINKLIGDIVQYRYIQGMEPNNVMKIMTKSGCEKQTAKELYEKVEHAMSQVQSAVIRTPEGRAEARRDALKEIRKSLIWIAAGAIITVITLSKNSPVSVIWYGPILYGIGKLIKNMFILIHLKKISVDT